MAKDFIVKKIKNKDFGVFASRNYKKDKRIFHVNLAKSRKHALKEIKENPELNAEHSNYVGKGKYVIDNSTASYMNHSCNPNASIINKNKFFAIKNIKIGQEITFDYSKTSWELKWGLPNEKDFQMNCNCKSKNCRRIIKDFPFLDKRLQEKFINQSIQDFIVKMYNERENNKSGCRSNYLSK